MAKEKSKAKKTSETWKNYETKGGFKRKNKTCPKCGSGVFLAQHKDRVTCGSCHYTEFTKKN